MGKPKTEHLTRDQIQAASLYVNGWTQQRIVDQLNISRSTIQRWLSNDKFVALVEDLRGVHAGAMESAAKQLEISEAELFERDLKSYREKRKTLSNMQVDTITGLLEKLQRRVEDLPEESFQPGQLASLLTAISNVSREAFDSWGELLGLRELKMKIEELNQTLEEAKEKNIDNYIDTEVETLDAT